MTPWTTQSMELSRPEYWSGYSLSLLQGIILTQRLNPGLPHCRQILYQLNYQGSLNALKRKELVARSWPTFSNPMDCSLPGSSVHGDSPGKNTGVGCYALLQVIFPTQGLNPDLLHCRLILYRLSHQESPRILEWLASLSLLQVIFLTQELNQGLQHCRWILY